ncbi:GNAT family N-acetyltransferase [Sphaerospermopsis aphanizomenoides BCCUSP55]|uniref:GNAT family N-acetyltransferase n=1 Tax=Sphaerospermopsis aphanizomenoides TaxID=459663 RepID=UPI001906FC42|nr:GNAT family N-acetyltransferase [Sphaerospermopsis aphanizomenoides]MBK1988847.1 GNAT family N-acetyltransferase [Sphaerospermopsis aphanizomenoides BCCUSP55]
MEYLHLAISTERLLLQPISLQYKEEIFQEFTAEITTYLYAAPPRRIGDTEFFINQSLLEMQRGENLIVVILKQDSQEFLGCSGIYKINSQYPQTGIWLKKSAFGQGYATEAIQALKKWADSHLEYEYLRYPVDQENTASRRIAEKLGGQIFTKYKHTNLSGNILNIVEYRIRKSTKY